MPTIQNARYLREVNGGREARVWHSAFANTYRGNVLLFFTDDFFCPGVLIAIGCFLSARFWYALMFFSVLMRDTVLRVSEYYAYGGLFSSFVYLFVSGSFFFAYTSEFFFYLTLGESGHIIFPKNIYNIELEIEYIWK